MEQCEKDLREVLRRIERVTGQASKAEPVLRRLVDWSVARSDLQYVPRDGDHPRLAFTHANLGTVWKAHAGDGKDQPKLEFLGGVKDKIARERFLAQVASAVPGLANARRARPAVPLSGQLSAAAVEAIICGLRSAMEGDMSGDS